VDFHERQFCLVAGPMQRRSRSHVDFPASSPHVLAVGGTRVTAAANNTIETETVWNDGAQGGATGGGYSTVFLRPAWQAADVTNPNRGVPDLAGNADPDTGYNILVDGQQLVVGGTSAVAPLMAGPIVLLNQTLNKHLGFANPALYGVERLNCFHDITAGNIGAYSAGFGWDPCTGLGSPIGTQLQQTLGSTSASAKQAQQQTHRTEHAHASGSK